ncbi:MAG: hypothetical protein HDQ95_05235 [Roseburia sp.]|nr:hypothetical protein [Roseburia sp.]
MKRHKNFRDSYLSLLRKIIEKLGYEVNGNDNTAWIVLILETAVLAGYYVISVLLTGKPTPVSLYLNTVLLLRYFLGNFRRVWRTNKKAKESKGDTEAYIIVHSRIALVEIAIIVAVCMMFYCYGIYWTETLLCVSIFFVEGWKDIHVEFFDAVPKY